MTKGAHQGVRASVLSGLFVTVISAFLAHPGVARAQAAGASPHFRRGQAEMSAGDAEAAAHDFLLAYREEPSAKTLLAVAMAYEKAGDAPAARAYYWWYLNSGAATAEEQEWLFARIVALSNPAKPKAEAAKKPPLTASTEARTPPPATAPEARTPPPAMAPEAPEPRPPAEAPPAPPAPPPPAAKVPSPPETTPVHTRHEAPQPSRLTAPPPGAPAETTPTHARWYGVPMLIFEPLALGAVIDGDGRGNGGEVTIGVLAMLAISPIVHAAHGHGGRGWGGFFARGAGAAIGGAAGGPTGAAVGYGAAALLDALVFCRDEVPDDQGSVVPAVSFQGGGASFGVAGRF